ncbi:hypothetical protein ACWGQ5_21410 [Streptomyces sp. NPDC055722]
MDQCRRHAESMVRTAQYGSNPMLAIIGGNPARFTRHAELFRQPTAHLGHGARPMGIHAPEHVAATDDQAAEQYWPFHETFLLQARYERDPPPGSSTSTN